MRSVGVQRGTATRQSVATGETCGTVGSRAVLAAILGAVLAACGAGVTLSSPPHAPRTDAPNVAATPSAASATAATTPVSQSPSRTPQPTPKPTPVPGPPKPSGVKFNERVHVSDDEAVAEFTQTVTWQTPRMEGIEIRVYGVTKCLAEPKDPPADSSGPCLVEHTALPPSVVTLLATAPALSAGGERSKPAATLAWSTTLMGLRTTQSCWQPTPRHGTRSLPLQSWRMVAPRC